MIAAAGSGERLGAGGPKALVEVAGRPLVAWCLNAQAEARSITAAVVAAPPGHEAELREAAERAVAGAIEVNVVPGGETRAESVATAFALVESELVSIHDAARPLAGAALVDAVVERLAASPGAAGVIAATPLTDTIKRARTQRDPAGTGGQAAQRAVAATEDRDSLWAAQTPQAFRTTALRDAHAAAREALAGATDEAMLVERAGGTVLIHPSSPQNLKVTTAHDLRVAELLLAG